MHSLRRIVCLAMKPSWSHDIITLKELHQSWNIGRAPREVIYYIGDLGRSVRDRNSTHFAHIPYEIISPKP